MGEIKFGTDGWRAVISEGFTFDNVKRVSQAIAGYVRLEIPKLKVKDKRVVVGYDTRFLSEKYAEIAASVLAANGIKTILTDRPTPTPSISYAIMERGLIGGIVITASHNPASYNGIKYKTQYGSSAGLEITDRIEGLIDKKKVRCMYIDEAKSKGLVKTEDIIPKHLGFIRRYVDLNLLRKSRLKVLADSMYGAGDGYIAKVLGKGNLRVDTIHSENNPGFGGISPEPKLPNLKELAQRVKRDRYDIGLATDGDADRLGVAIPSGRMLTGHKVMAVLLLHLLEDRNMRGDVIQTICGTGLVEKICMKYNLKMHETPVGFKYISAVMVKKDVLLGGEETGGVAFKGSIPERDGLLSGLLILEMMAMRRKKMLNILKDIDNEYGAYEYRRLDVKYPDESKQKLMKFLMASPPNNVLNKKIVKIKDVDGYKFICADSSWLMFRLSGTEPILRVYAEASNEKRAFDILDFGKKIAYSV